MLRKSGGSGIMYDIEIYSDVFSCVGTEKIMDWIYHFDIAAVILDIMLLIQFYATKQVKTKSRRTFAILLFTGMSAAILDLATIYPLTHADTFPLALNHLINAVFLMFTNLVVPIFTYYFIVTIDEHTVTEFPKRWWYFLPSFTSLILTATSPFTGLVYYFDENLQYRHGLGVIILYASTILYISIIVGLLIKNRRVIPNNQFAAMTIYIVFSILAIAIQASFPSLLVQMFAFSLALNMGFNLIQRPFDQVNYVTGVFNNKAMVMDITNKTAARRKCMVYSVKLEDFDAIDNIFGTTYGNMVLREITSFFRSVKGNAAMYQAHRNHFVFCVENKEEMALAEATARRIHKRFDEPFVVKGDNAWVKAVIFEMRCPDVFSNAKNIIDVIEYLHTCERPFVNDNINIAGFNLIEKIDRTNHMKAIVERAISKEEFIVHYRPVYSIKEKKCLSAQVEMRLFNEDYGFIDSEEIMTVAEQSGKMTRISEIIFEEVCRFISEKKPQQHGLQNIEFCLSMAHLMLSDCMRKFYSLLEKYEIPYDYIHFRITESTIDSSHQKIHEIMNKMSEKNIKFTLDDYGSNRTSTSKITSLPFTGVKLDKWLVHAAGGSEKVLKMLVHTANVMWDMGMDVVADGADTEDDISLLESIGIDLVQGSYFSGAVSSGELLGLLGADNSETAEAEE